MPVGLEKRSIAWLYATYFEEDFIFCSEKEWSDKEKEVFIEKTIDSRGRSFWITVEMQEQISEYGSISYIVLAGKNAIDALADFIQGGICYEFEKTGFSDMSRAEQDQFLCIKLPIFVYAHDHPIEY
jgi:hypothetical protein